MKNYSLLFVFFIFWSCSKEAPKPTEKVCPQVLPPEAKLDTTSFYKINGITKNFMLNKSKSVWGENLQLLNLEHTLYSNTYDFTSLKINFIEKPTVRKKYLISNNLNTNQNVSVYYSVYNESTMPKFKSYDSALLVNDSLEVYFDSFGQMHIDIQSAKLINLAFIDTQIVYDTIKLEGKLVWKKFNQLY